MSIPKHVTAAVAIMATVGLGIPAASFARSIMTEASVMTAAPLMAAASAVTPVSIVTAAPLGAAAADKKPAEKKLTIVGLDSQLKFTAQHNPEEIRVEKSVPWSKSKTSSGDQPELQFTSAEGRSMSFELTFDSLEANSDVHAAYVSKLLALTMVMDPTGPEDKKRPSRVRVQWGAGGWGFDGVIESVDVKYTMFLPNGTPVRATCTVKLQEASRASFKK